MTPASNIFFLLLLAESILLSLFVGLGKGTHQFSKVLFPLRYQVEVMKNDYQRVVNELSKEEERTMPTRRPTITLFPTLAPAKPTAKPTPKVVYRRPTNKPPQAVPTTDWSWINQKGAENKAWFDQQVAKQKADSEASRAASDAWLQSESAKSKAAGDAWFAEQVAKQQAEQEAWKKAHGL